MSESDFCGGASEEAMATPEQRTSTKQRQKRVEEGSNTMMALIQIIKNFIVTVDKQLESFGIYKKTENPNPKYK